MSGNKDNEDSLKTTGDVSTDGSNLIQDFFANTGAETTGASQTQYEFEIVIENLIVDEATGMDEKKIIEDMLAVLLDADNSAGSFA